MIVINKFSVVDAAHKIGAVKLSIAFLIYLEMIEFFNSPIIWLLPRTRGSSSLSTITIITAIFMRNRNILKSIISIVIYASRNRHRSTSISIFLVLMLFPVISRYPISVRTAVPAMINGLRWGLRNL